MAKSRELAQFANVSLTKGFVAWQALTKALFDDYRPELHYMRGPGPGGKTKPKPDQGVRLNPGCASNSP
jgi:hypothetical protein